jgi:hypothetical protein
VTKGEFAVVLEVFVVWPHEFTKTKECMEGSCEEGNKKNIVETCGGRKERAN